MSPATDRLTGISTTKTQQPSTGGARQASDPAAIPAAAAPVSARPRGASAGTPSPVRAPRPAGEGTKSSRPEGSPTPLQGAASTSPLDRGRAVAGTEAGSGRVGGTRDAAESPLPAGTRGLSGAEWRAAAKAAQSKARRGRPARGGAAKPAAEVTTPPPVTGGAALTASANCLGRCGWTAGPGDPGEVDKAAAKHTKAELGHPTNTVSVVAEIGGTA